MVEVSVILPAYNCSAYLAEAVQSVLRQTFSNFELLLINDGSTDNTAFVIKSFSDERIVALDNNGNKGLIYTLNRGIREARGKYIARMDADDICLPQRLELQYNHLERHPGIAVVGSFYSVIDEDGKECGFYAPDREANTPANIRKMMPRENCIAHPSVMMRKEVAAAFMYAPYQKNIEDYDLWLRMLSRGKQLDKINEVLLRYRVHGASVTKQHLQKKNPFFKMLGCKKRFLLHQLKQFSFGTFELAVAAYAIRDLMIGTGKELKKKLSR